MSSGECSRRRPIDVEYVRIRVFRNLCLRTLHLQPLRCLRLCYPTACSSFFGARDTELYSAVQILLQTTFQGFYVFNILTPFDRGISKQSRRKYVCVCVCSTSKSLFRGKARRKNERKGGGNHNAIFYFLSLQYM